MEKQRRVLWETNQDILVLLCIPLHVTRARKPVWLHLDVIRRLRDYLWDIIQPGRGPPKVVLDARRFRRYGGILLRIGLTSEEISKPCDRRLPTFKVSRDVRRVHNKERGLLTAIGVPPHLEIDRWDTEWMIKVVASSSIGPRLLDGKLE